MSAMGEKRRTKLGSGFVRSALPPKADNRVDVSLYPLRATNGHTPFRPVTPFM